MIGFVKAVKSTAYATPTTSWQALYESLWFADRRTRPLHCHMSWSDIAKVGLNSPPCILTWTRKGLELTVMICQGILGKSYNHARCSYIHVTFMNSILIVPLNWCVGLWFLESRQPRLARLIEWDFWESYHLVGKVRASSAPRTAWCARSRVGITFTKLWMWRILLSSWSYSSN